MSEEGSSPGEMKDLTSTSFGYLIAFVLPGIFGLYALGYWTSDLEKILQPIIKADASVGPSFVFLVISVGMGLCLSAIRHLIFEKLVCRKHSFPDNTFALLYKENKLTAFKAIVDEHYRYHQFYGNCAVALLLLFSGWFYHHWSFNFELLRLGAVFVLSELILGHASYDTFVKYVKRGCTVVTEHPTTEGEAEK